MIVGYGHLLVLIKKQLSDQYRKAANRIDFKKKRESYFHHEESYTMEFPQVSALELEIIKKEIRKKAKKEFQTKLIKEGTIFISLLIAISYWATNYLFV